MKYRLAFILISFTPEYATRRIRTKSLHTRKTVCNFMQFITALSFLVYALHMQGCERQEKSGGCMNINGAQMMSTIQTYCLKVELNCSYASLLFISHLNMLLYVVCKHKTVSGLYGLKQYNNMYINQTAPSAHGLYSAAFFFFALLVVLDFLACLFVHIFSAFYPMLLNICICLIMQDLVNQYGRQWWRSIELRWPLKMLLWHCVRWQTCKYYIWTRLCRTDSNWSSTLIFTDFEVLKIEND